MNRTQPRNDSSGNPFSGEYLPQTNPRSVFRPATGQGFAEAHKNMLILNQMGWVPLRSLWHRTLFACPEMGRKNWEWFHWRRRIRNGGFDAKGEAKNNETKRTNLALFIGNSKESDVKEASFSKKFVALQ